MIVAFVKFQLPAPRSEAVAKQLFGSSAPSYRGMAGLVRTDYILSEDEGVACGVYFWQDCAAAERAYDEQRHRRVRDLYGADPQIAWFSTPVTVYNEGTR